MSNSSAGTSSKPRTASSQPSETSSKRKRGVFQKELQHMMYGFGDDPNPLPESVALMEDIVVEYVTELVHKAQDIGSQRGKLSVEDFLYLIRKRLIFWFVKGLNMHWQKTFLHESYAIIFHLGEQMYHDTIRN
ncbi:transcription initiation factor TFIID subunit 13-like isoform X2 [Glycine soja]|uniref:transcription initiation factor TFIID subunit 13-like isoform X2 n=1 Tax=Glycine soja TaxID=3848 RepID=UPI0010394C73|nr:transcription initiation factor TFIID subunit 13-like isoform X2 [Glycine soja]